MASGGLDHGPAPQAPQAPRGPRGPRGSREADDARRRMLTARRRLLGMLVTLEVAAIALAVIGLAAAWVVLPPTIMLAGYLLLLREAARADAERADADAEAAAAAAIRALERATARRQASQATEAARRVTPVDGTPLAPLAARFAAAPVAADYEEAPGRDFAPGLAGKYTPSRADPELGELDGEEPYGYEEHGYRRAVGD